MVRHQAICQYGQPEPDVLFLQEINIHYSVGFHEKNIHGSNVPLNNVVRATGNDDSFHSCHVRNYTWIDELFNKITALCPRNFLII